MHRLATRPAGSTTPWIVVPEPRPSARVRLLCFPHAGGGASSYHAWSTRLPAEIEVCAIQLPGRESRIREIPVHNLRAIVSRLADELQVELKGTFAFFGHSMGALLAFELARLLRRRGDALPVHLFFSGREAPHLPKVIQPLSHLDDERLIEEVRRLKGTPEEILHHRELLELLLPALRADFAACETYSCAPEPPLDCPATVLGGTRDNVDRADLEAWRQHIDGPFSVRMFPGDHFFPVTDLDLVLRLVSDTLLRPGQGAPPVAEE